MAMLWLSMPGVCFESKRKVIVLESLLRLMWPLPLPLVSRRADEVPPLMSGLFSSAVWFEDLVDIDRLIWRVKDGRAVGRSKHGHGQQLNLYYSV